MINSLNSLWDWDQHTLEIGVDMIYLIILKNRGHALCIHGKDSHLVICFLWLNHVNPLAFKQKLYDKHVNTEGLLLVSDNLAIAKSQDLSLHWCFSKGYHPSLTSPYISLYQNCCRLMKCDSI